MCKEAKLMRTKVKNERERERERDHQYTNIRTQQNSTKWSKFFETKLDKKIYLLADRDLALS